MMEVTKRETVLPELGGVQPSPVLSAPIIETWHVVGKVSL